MSATYQFIQGKLPVFVSMPHNGIELPEAVRVDMTASARKLVDTDWYLDRIYQFAREMGCYLINPVYSRYLIDLNRDPHGRSLYPGADTTELCPTSQFDGQPVYLPEKLPSPDEILFRQQKYWQPYHTKIEQTLKVIKQRFGYALLFEAHSIKSEVPRFFEGQLADFNFGSFNSLSCSKALTELIDGWNPQGYSKVVNGRFKGGYITRHYGKPQANIDSLQLELSQATYMNEKEMNYNEEKARQVIIVIKDLFNRIQKVSQELIKSC